MRRITLLVLLLLLSLSALAQTAYQTRPAPVQLGGFMNPSLVAKLSLAPGTYLLRAKVGLRNVNEGTSILSAVQCQLTIGNANVVADASRATLVLGQNVESPSDESATVVLQSSMSSSMSKTAKVFCHAPGPAPSSITTENVDFEALKVSSIGQQ